jgi:competence ComEA-like helix-hairpin-helix protein
VIDHGLGSNGAGSKKKKKPEPSTVVCEIEPGVKLNINTATANDLMEKLGMKRDYAYAITGYRRKHGLFKDIEELLLAERFYKPAYERYKDYLTVTDEVAEEPPKPKMGMKTTPAPVVKYNVNAASAYELQQAGFNKNQAHKIVGSRKRNGPFYEIEDLLKIDGIKKKDIRKLRPVLEV